MDIEKQIQRLLKRRCCCSIPEVTEFPADPQDGRQVILDDIVYIFINGEWNVIDTYPVGAPDISPEHTFGSTSYAEAQSKDVVLRIRNLGDTVSSGTIFITIPKIDPIFSLSISDATLTTTVGVTTYTVINSDLDVYEYSDRWELHTKTGVTIAANTTAYIGLSITATGVQSDVATFTTKVEPYSGGESVINNNVKRTVLSID